MGHVSDIYYVYLYRSDAVDDWKPETLKIYCNNTWCLTYNLHLDFSLPNVAWRRLVW